MGNVKADKSGKLTLVQPSTEFYSGSPVENQVVITIHVGTNEDGEIFPIVGKPRYSGGLEYTSAQNEFHLTKDSLEGGVPVSLPIAYGKFELRLDGTEIGFVILGARDSLDRRLAQLWQVTPQQTEGKLKLIMSDYLEEWAYKRVKSAEGYVTFFGDLRYSQGVALRLFHESGFARHAGHSGNYQIDEQQGDVVLVDLDSSIRLGNIDERAVFLTRTLDVVSALRGIHADECNSPIRSLLDTKGRMNPYIRFLQGYLNLGAKERGKIDPVDRELYEVGTEPYRLSEQDIYLAARSSFTIYAIAKTFPLMERALVHQDIQPPYGRSQLREELGRCVQAWIGLETQLRENYNTNPADFNPFDKKLLDRAL